jgi:hypothetical protein
VAPSSNSFRDIGSNREKKGCRAVNEESNSCYSITDGAGNIYEKVRETWRRAEFVAGTSAEVVLGVTKPMVFAHD